MLLKALFLACLATISKSVDLNSLAPRTVCYSLEQEGCNTTFLEAYPELSMSVTNLTVADTFFWLFTRENPADPENLQKCAGRLPPGSHFDPSNKLVVILNPFFVGYCDIAAFREWQMEILQAEDANILGVDYSWGSKIDVGTAEENLHIVARQVEIVLRNIMEDTGLSYRMITLVSLSLGSQLAGLIGGLVHVGRIIGLDPAGPGYNEETDLANRLDRSDADLVEVWHANMGYCLPEIGIPYDAGHINYYINGGRIQLGCYEHALISLLTGDYLLGIGSLIYPQLCYHAFVVEYFRVSINPRCCQFVGVQCPSKEACQTGLLDRECGCDGSQCQIMGYDLPEVLEEVPQDPVRYYVDTMLECPYCKNDQVKLQGFTDTYRKIIQNESCNLDAEQSDDCGPSSSDQALVSANLLK